MKSKFFKELSVNKLIVAFLILVITTGVMVLVLNSVIDIYNKKNWKNETVVQVENIKEHDVKKFFDEYLFQKGISGDKSKIEVHGEIYGAIVPHHLIPSFIIADIFERITKQDTKTIILLAPNHHDVGNTPVVVGALEWNTPYGKIMPNTEMISKLSQKDYISIDDQILDNEHGIAGLLPFITYHRNDIKIVPIILRQNITREQINDLSKSIVDIKNDNAVIVASVDFSHFLTSAEAEQNDKRTKMMMKDHDIDELLRMNTDYLDSPEAISVLLQTMKQIEVPSMNILYNTNSGYLMNDPYGETTSYFGIVFAR
ncbi:MAG: AmmeMemoRadiSam system protein B [Patescibacteria group bacterium]